MGGGGTTPKGKGGTGAAAGDEPIVSLNEPAGEARIVGGNGEVRAEDGLLYDCGDGDARFEGVLLA